jgi:septal ring factor EnvC (AmiA/AmiB activator)
MNAEQFAVTDAMLRSAIVSASTHNEKVFFEAQLAMLELIRQMWSELESMRIIIERYETEQRKLDIRIQAQKQSIASVDNKVQNIAAELRDHIETLSNELNSLKEH